MTGGPAEEVGGHREAVLHRFGKLSLQFHLHHLRVTAVHQAQAPHHPPEMGVDDNGRAPQHITQIAVGGLASHARQPGQPGKRRRDFLSFKFPGKSDDVLCLRVEETGRMDQPFHIRLLGVGKVVPGRISAEQLRHHRVDRLVGGLGGEDDADKEPERFPFGQEPDGWRTQSIQTFGNLYRITHTSIIA